MTHLFFQAVNLAVVAVLVAALYVWTLTPAWTIWHEFIGGLAHAMGGQ